MSGSEAVWLATVTAMAGKGFRFACEQKESEYDAYIALLHRFARDAGVDENELPDVMWCDRGKDDRKTKLPHLFKPSGFLAVSQQMKDVLEQFDLGGSWFKPVQFLHMDRKRPYPGQFYFFYLPQRKPAFAPEHSSGFSPKLFEDQTHDGTLERDVTDDQIKVFPSASQGVDVWHDDGLLDSLLFGDRAYQAIDAAGLAGDLLPVRCPVFAPNLFTRVLANQRQYPKLP